MVFKCVLCVLLILCLVLAATACGSKSPALQSEIGSGSGSVPSDTADAGSDGDPAPVEDETSATLTINVHSGTDEKFSSPRTRDPNKEDITVILVMGQSNFEMTVGYILDCRQYYDEKVSDVPPTLPIAPTAGIGYTSMRKGAITSLDSSRDIANLIDRSNGNNGISGVTPPFAAEWNRLTGTKVVFVQAAHGGTGLHEWMPNPHDYYCNCSNGGKFELYSSAVSNYNISYKALSEKYNIVYTGYIWNQGEHEQFTTSGVSIATAKDYYDAYKKMHETIMDTLKLDFGGISVVRYNLIKTPNSHDSMRLCAPRLAQYRLCNDIDDLYMLSTIAETCDASQVGKAGETAHMNQTVFNTMGTEMADNLYKRLGLDEQSAFDGVQVYGEDGVQICAFDADGKVSSGTASVDCGSTDPKILVKLASLGNAYTLDYSLSYKGNVIEDGIDEFGQINGSQLNKAYGIQKVNIVCKIS